MGDEFVEVAIQAMRLTGDGTIQLTCKIDYDDEDNAVVVDWDKDGRDLTFDMLAQQVAKLYTKIER